MERLIIDGNNVKWGDKDLFKIGYGKVDELMVHIYFTDCAIGFKGGETEINGVLKNTSQEIIDCL